MHFLKGSEKMLFFLEMSDVRNIFYDRIFLGISHI